MEIICDPFYVAATRQQQQCLQIPRIRSLPTFGHYVSAVPHLFQASGIDLFRIEDPCFVDIGDQIDNDEPGPATPHRPPASVEEDPENLGVTTHRPPLTQIKPPPVVRQLKQARTLRSSNVENERQDTGASVLFSIFCILTLASCAYGITKLLLLEKQQNKPVLDPVLVPLPSMVAASIYPSPSSSIHRTGSNTGNPGTGSNTTSEEDEDNDAVSMSTTNSSQVYSSSPEPSPTTTSDDHKSGTDISMTIGNQLPLTTTAARSHIGLFAIVGILAATFPPFFATLLFLNSASTRRGWLAVVLVLASIAIVSAACLKYYVFAGIVAGSSGLLLSMVTVVNSCRNCARNQLAFCDSVLKHGLRTIVGAYPSMFVVAILAALLQYALTVIFVTGMVGLLSDTIVVMFPKLVWPVLAIQATGFVVISQVLKQLLLCTYTGVYSLYFFYHNTHRVIINPVFESLKKALTINFGSTCKAAIAVPISNLFLNFQKLHRRANTMCYVYTTLRASASFRDTATASYDVIKKRRLLESLSDNSLQYLPIAASLTAATACGLTGFVHALQFIPNESSDHWPSGSCSAEWLRIGLITLAATIVGLFSTQGALTPFFEGVLNAVFVLECEEGAKDGTSVVRRSNRQMHAAFQTAFSDQIVTKTTVSTTVVVATTTKLVKPKEEIVV